MIYREVIVLRCDEKDCSDNENGVCLPMEQNKSTPCHKDVFHCARCGLTMMMKEPLERERCPSCRTRAWDLGEMDCYECGHRWTPRSDTPQFCPECRTRLKTV